MTVLAPLSAAPPASELRPSWQRLVLALVTARRAPSLALHCLLAWPVAMLPSAAFIGLAYGLTAALGVDVVPLSPPDQEASFKDFFGSVVFAPLAETLLLGGLLWLLGRLSSRPLFIAAASSVLWGSLHAAFGALWFFGTFWSFYVFSCSYLAWRPLGFRQAFVAAAVPHALINLTAMLLLLLR